MLALPAVFFTPGARAQAVRTASKSADISVFGGVEFVNPEYGRYNNTGGAVGVDYTRYFHLPIVPSVEARANFNNGPVADERSYLFGLRGRYDYNRFHPYVDFLIGPGTIHFPRNVGYLGDNSIVYNYGGGVDVGVTRDFSLKLDFQGQRWNTGDQPFTPFLGLVGVTYTIPFRPHVSQRSFGR